MKTTIVLLLAFILILALTFPVMAQTAREVIKADSQIALESAKVDVDKLIGETRAALKEEERIKASNRIRIRIDELIEADPSLRTRLLNEE